MAIAVIQSETRRQVCEDCDDCIPVKDAGTMVDGRRIGEDQCYCRALPDKMLWRTCTWKRMLTDADARCPSKDVERAVRFQYAKTEGGDGCGGQAHAMQTEQSMPPDRQANIVSGYGIRGHHAEVQVWQ